MTDDELDEARVARAVATVGISAGMTRIARQVARLTREGWMPPKPVDPVREAVKEALVTALNAGGFPRTALELREESDTESVAMIDAATASLRKSGVLK